MSLVFDGAFNDLRFYIWYALYHPCAVDAYLGCAAVLQTLLRQPWRCWAILSHRSMIGCLHGASPTTLKWRCRMTFSWRSLRRLTTAFWLSDNTARKKPRLAKWKPRTTTKTPGIGPPRWMTTMTMTMAIQIMDGHPGGVGKGTAGILGQAGPGTKRIMTMMMIGAMTMSMDNDYDSWGRWSRWGKDHDDLVSIAESEPPMESTASTTTMPLIQPAPLLRTSSVDTPWAPRLRKRKTGCDDDLPAAFKRRMHETGRAYDK